MIKLKIPKDKPEDIQKYVIVESKQMGPRTIDTAQVVSEDSLNAEKQALQNQITEWQAKVETINNKISEIKK